ARQTTSMNDEDRFKLYFGPYKTPRFRYGQKVWCESRGWMKIVGLSDGKIPWPIGRLVTPPTGRDSLIIYRGLKRGIERESNQAVAHFWGVSRGTVRRWRRALDVGRKTPGTLRLQEEALKAPSRRSKIADAKRGKPRPKSVVEALREANKGRRLSEDHRRKMSESHRKRGTRPRWLNAAWEPWEDEAARTLSINAAMQKTGRSRNAVLMRRRKLRVPDGRTKAARKKVGRSK
ncbi:MAG: hypothetical protein WD049_05315, partial [Candidatus Paceibacterota bacterium]